MTDARLLWPDSYAVSKDGYLYISTSQVHTAPPFGGAADREQVPAGDHRALEARIGERTGETQRAVGTSVAGTGSHGRTRNPRPTISTQASRRTSSARYCVTASSSPAPTRRSV